jgi:hypothetical protein
MVFQIITLEGWTAIMYSLEKATNTVTNIYFIAIVFIGAFFLINLTMAVITIYFMMSQ